MTRKDYFNVAYALRRSHPLDAKLEIASDAFFERLQQWEQTVLGMASVLDENYVNFNRDIFLAAAGYSIKPDGSMWSVDWERNRIPNWRSL